MSKRTNQQDTGYTLKMLVGELYNKENPILYAIPPTQDGFIKTIFPDELCTTSFFDENGKEYSVKQVLTDTSRLSNIFNGKSQEYKFRDNLYVILKLRLDIWDGICDRCNQEISKAEKSEQVIPRLKEVVNTCVEEGEYQSALLDSLPEECGVALAGLILYLVLQGEVESMLDIIKGTPSVANQFSYLETATAMLMPIFAQCYDSKKEDEMIEKYFNQYSRLFSCIAEKTSQTDDTFLESIYQSILRGEEDKLVCISGAAGMEKNAITQLLYLKLSAQVRAGMHPRVAPYYVNLSFYEGLYLKDEASARERLTADLAPFMEYCEKHTRRIPYLFVDGVKNYTINGCEIDYTLNQIIEEMPRVKLIVAAENGAATNPLRQRCAPGFAAGEFARRVELNSVYLSESSQAEEYLQAFQELCGYQVKSKESSISKRLQELGLTHIDTYQLKMLMSRLWDASNLADLYERICVDFLNGDSSQLPQGAEWAYRFAYTDEELPPISGKMIQLLTSHESVQDYFIARWYYSKIREGRQQDVIGTLNMVLPKGVTQFVVPMMNRSSAGVNRILLLIEQNYHQMGLMAKAQMTHWLGHICAPGMTERAEQLLESIYEEQKKELAQTSVTDPDYRQKLFVLERTSVSLIVKGHTDVWDEYLALLLHNSAANEINRGFHLEYYGDKVYMPVYNNLNFVDDITKGKRTLDQLMTANNQSETKYEQSLMYELNLFTICSLIQARMEKQESGINFDLREYMKKVYETIQKYLNSEESERTTSLFREYLKMMEHDLNERLRLGKNAAWSPIGALVYEHYSKGMEHSGWVKEGVYEPETVAEHMYRCWLLGMLYLPEYAPNLKGYSKEKILKLLMICNIAEAVTGDLPAQEKQRDTERFRREESEQMGMFLLRGSYPGMASMQEEYEVWQSWSDGRDINRLIVREINVISSLFRFLTCASSHPEQFRREEIQQFERQRSQVRSAVGNAILKMLINENKSFDSVLQWAKK